MSLLSRLLGDLNGGLGDGCIGTPAAVLAACRLEGTCFAAVNLVSATNRLALELLVTVGAYLSLAHHATSAPYRLGVCRPLLVS